MSGRIDIRPRYLGDDPVPYCAEEACPSYDGKRCRVLGHRPGNICEPQVRDDLTELRTHERKT